MAIDLQTLYVVDQKDGLGLEFSKLVSMMNYVGRPTISSNGSMYSRMN